MNIDKKFHYNAIKLIFLTQFSLFGIIFMRFSCYCHVVSATKKAQGLFFFLSPLFYLTLKFQRAFFKIDVVKFAASR